MFRNASSRLTLLKPNDGTRKYSNGFLTRPEKIHHWRGTPKVDWAPVVRGAWGVSQMPPLPLMGRLGLVEGISNRGSGVGAEGPREAAEPPWTSPVLPAAPVTPAGLFVEAGFAPPSPVVAEGFAPSAPEAGACTLST